MFEFDPFQKRAIAAIGENKSVLVSAPTGAGKTVIAEHAIETAMARGLNVIYTAPIKALSNQKYRDFSAKYGDKVGLLTGDVSLNPSAPLMIMTTEIYRNQLFENPERHDATAWVIFDEVHYLDDPERGTVWEEAIMFTPPHVRLVCLSATAPNIEELAQWIKEILNHSIEIIIETHRPIPLHHLFHCQNKVFDDTRDLKREGYLNQDIWPNAFRGDNKHHRRGGGRRHGNVVLRAKPNRIFDLLRHIDEKKGFPVLYFAFGRKRTEELAWEHRNLNFLNEKEKAQVQEIIDRLYVKYNLLQEPSAIDMAPLLVHGIAFHHAGMLPTLKEVVEQLFTSRLIKLIFTTETFALGINMPAKSVIFDELRKFYGTGFANLRTRDYFQMAGRAGRRGIDTTGSVYSRINPHEISHSAIVRMVYGQPEPIESQFNSGYATLLNLYAKFKEKLIDIYPRSFHYFQSNKNGRRRRQASLERKILLLKQLGYIQNEALTAKGEFASWMYGYELLIAEMLVDGSLDNLTEIELAAFLCALVFEPRRKEPCPALDPHFRGIARKSEAIFQQIAKHEVGYKIWPPSKEPHFHLSAAIEAWMKGTPFADLERFTSADEGEIIRYFRMVIQLLRQIYQAPQVSPALQKKAKSAMALVNRDIVDAEKQLRSI